MNTCPNCAAAIPADAPAGLCPACLLRAAVPLHQPLVATEELPLPVERIREVDSTTAEQRTRVQALFARRLPDLVIKGFVGAGGMGEVWLAEHRALGRKVAVKLLSEEVAQEAGFSERFTREARAMAKLDHPRVVKIHDFGESDGVFFLVMEYHPGNLRERMEKGPMSLNETLAVMLPLCDAGSAVHKAGLIHRDLKPENILANKNGLKLADFGLACAGTEASAAGTSAPAKGGRLTEAGGIIGTPAYMAPEQWRTPEKVDARADVYALGLILAEMLTGKLPRGRYIQPSDVCGDVRLDRIVARALQPDPKNRYQTVNEMRSELQAVSTSPRWHAVVFDVFLLASIPLFLLVAVVYWHGVLASYLLCSVIWVLAQNYYSTWVRRANAVLVTCGVLAYDLIGPALWLPPFDTENLVSAVVMDAVALVIVLFLALGKLLFQVGIRRVGPVFLMAGLLLVLSLVGYVPAFWVVGKWMPLVVASLVLGLWWYSGSMRWAEPAAPVVESPFGP